MKIIHYYSKLVTGVLRWLVGGFVVVRLAAAWVMCLSASRRSIKVHRFAVSVLATSFLFVVALVVAVIVQVTCVCDLVERFDIEPYSDFSSK